MASQEVFLLIDADRISPKVERAVRMNNADKIADMSQNIQRGDRLLRSWLEDNGGRVLLFHGDEIYASLPGEKLSDLGKIHEQLQEAWDDSITIGVGLDLSEAKKALDAGKKRGGSRIVFYAPEIEQMLPDEESASDSHAAKEESPDPEKLKSLEKAEFGRMRGIHAIKHYNLSQPDTVKKAQENLTPYGPPQQSASGETPVTPSATNMADGLPSAAPPGASAVEEQFHTAAAGTEAEAARSEAQAQAAQPVDPGMEAIKAKIVAVLQKVKAQAQVIEQLKEQAPEAYQAVLGAIQAMLTMAKAITPAAQQQEQAPQERPAQKSEDWEDLSKGERELRAIRSLILNDSATPEQLDQAIKTIGENRKQFNDDVLQDLLAHPNIAPNHVKFLLEDGLKRYEEHRKNYRGRPNYDLWYPIEHLLEHKKLSVTDAMEAAKKVKEQVKAPSSYEDSWGGKVKGFDLLKQVAEHVVQDQDRPMTPEEYNLVWPHLNTGRRTEVIERHDVPAELVARAAKIPSMYDAVAGSPKLSPADHKRILNQTIRAIKKHRAAGDHQREEWMDASERFHTIRDRLGKLLYSPNMPMEEAKKLAAQHYAHPDDKNKAIFGRDPDSAHAEKKDPTFRQLNVRVGSHPYRIIRDMAEGAGGQVHFSEIQKDPVLAGVPYTQARVVKPITPEEYEKKFARTPPERRPPIEKITGTKTDFVSSDNMQKLIDSMPALKLYATEHAWTGAQKHSTDPSKVLRVSLPTDVTEKLLGEGIRTEMGHSSGHPGDPISGLGWIRWTGDEKGVHIDEIQHDYDHGAQQKIEKLLGHPINRVLHDAFHEWIRNKAAEPKTEQPKPAEPTPAPTPAPTIPGRKKKKVATPPVPGGPPTIGTPVHVWQPESKAPLSGLDEDRDLPLHFHQTYRETPTKMGYKPASYGQLPTQFNSDLKDNPTYGESFRKSLKDIRAAALAKSYRIADPLTPKSTGIDNAVKVSSDVYPTNKIEPDPGSKVPSGSRLSKIRKGAMKKAQLPMPEQTNKMPHTPSGAMAIRVEGDAAPQAHKYRHIQPGEAAHVSMDGKPQGTIAIRQYQSGMTMPNENVGEGQTGIIHPTSALDPQDGREKQDEGE